MSSKYIIVGDDKKNRCWWGGKQDIYIDYHDTEWGRPVSDDNRLYEKICLEGFQAGLSWLTILRKRNDFRRCFKGFEVTKVARMTERSVEKLLLDATIVRHRGKIESTINNAKRAKEMIRKYGSLANFFWNFEPQGAVKFDPKRATTDESVQMSKRLKKLGWSFVGPTTCYSFMQSMGIVNDHHPDCHLWKKIESERRKFKRPKS